MADLPHTRITTEWFPHGSIFHWYTTLCEAAMDARRFRADLNSAECMRWIKGYPVYGKYLLEQSTMCWPCSGRPSPVRGAMGAMNQSHRRRAYRSKIFFQPHIVQSSPHPLKFGIQSNSVRSRRLQDLLHDLLHDLLQHPPHHYLSTKKIVKSSLLARVILASHRSKYSAQDLNVSRSCDIYSGRHIV